MSKALEKLESPVWGWFLTHWHTIARTREGRPCSAQKDGLFRNNGKCLAFESHSLRCPSLHASESRAKHPFACCDWVYLSHTQLQGAATCKQNLVDAPAGEGHHGTCSSSFNLNYTLSLSLNSASPHAFWELVVGKYNFHSYSVLLFLKCKCNWNAVNKPNQFSFRFLTQKMRKNKSVFPFLLSYAADTTMLKVHWWTELSDDPTSPLLGK